MRDARFCGCLGLLAPVWQSKKECMIKCGYHLTVGTKFKCLSEDSELCLLCPLAAQEGKDRQCK